MEYTYEFPDDYLREIRRQLWRWNARSQYSEVDQGLPGIEEKLIEKTASPSF